MPYGKTDKHDAGRFFSCRNALYPTTNRALPTARWFCLWFSCRLGRFDNLAHVPRGTTAEKGNSLRVFRLHRATSTMTLLAVEVSGNSQHP